RRDHLRANRVSRSMPRILAADPCRRRRHRHALIDRVTILLRADVGDDRYVKSIRSTSHSALVQAAMQREWPIHRWTRPLAEAARAPHVDMKEHPGAGPQVRRHPV